ncbi:MAG: SDR family NAD(P)-dependent oxidoreductase [Pseudomonadales bacterium]
MDQFTNKIAVITGAGSGIGRALAQHCAAEGMRVALADLHTGRLETLAEQLKDAGTEVLSCSLDVADPEKVSAFAEQVGSTFGTPDLLFNNAGILRVGETWTQSYQQWQQLLSVNLMGVVNGLNAFVPAMIESGQPAHIINTGSVGSLVVAPGMAQYTAAKMAVRGITESLLYDLKAQNSSIDVSLLCPGPVLTSIADELMGLEPDDSVAAPTEHLMAGQPNFIPPIDVAEIVFQAIRERRFWIFTHLFNKHLELMTKDMLEGRNPEYREVEFDL